MRLAAIHSLTDARNAAPSRTAVAGSRLLETGILGRIRGWLKQRAVLAELRGLDHRTLADLCIYPGDFQAIAEGTYVREGGAHDVALTPAAGPSSSGQQAKPYY